MSVLDDLPKEMNRAIGSEIDDLTLVEVTSSYDPQTGESTESTNTYSCKGHSQEISERFLANTEVTISDREFVILQETLSVDPEDLDKVKDDGQDFDIVMVNKDPSDSVWILVGRS